MIGHWSPVHWVGGTLPGGPVLTTPTIAVADAMNGGGVIVTLANGDAAIENAVWYLPARGGVDSAELNFFGQRTGNGAIVGTVPKGLYFWVATSFALGGNIDMGQGILAAVTDGSLALHERILQSALARLNMMTLPRVREIKRQRRPSEWNVDSFSLILTTIDETETYAEYSTAHDNTLFPVYVLRNAPPMSARAIEDEPDWLMVGERIRRGFRAQRLPGVPEVRTCTVEPVQVTRDTEGVEKVFSGHVLRFDAREVRGLNA